MSIILYFGIGLTITASQFFMFFLILFMVVICCSSLGYFISSIFTHSETSVMMAPLILLPLIMFAGFFSNSGSLPVWISWFQYVSPVRYALECLIRNEFESRVVPASSQNFVEYLGFKLGITTCLVILAGMTIFFRVVTCICLKLLVSKFQ